MRVWSAVKAVLFFPGAFVVTRMPEMEAEASRLLFHMVNYIFWLTPTIGILIWLVIRHALANV